MGKDFEFDLDRCLECLNGDGIFLYPTDTVWGLGGDATNEAAAERIMKLKNRPAHKSFVILVADEQQLAGYVDNIDPRITEYLAHFKKPTTVIYPSAHGLAPTAVATDQSVAIRICREPFCQALLLQSGKPLLSTSANLSGEATPGIFSEINSVIKNGVDYVVQYKREQLSPAEPSTIIKWHPAFFESGSGLASPVEVIRL
ncbi:L-threonylcarbamoyladenylate synthase [Arachidicoccus rhizosphaerae]|uniref:L-threonylcarbamoyladenylate synthase n=1 Tax=Arachidicoccus rhizosphaerae TaxID=551991 RepID=A0A1H3YJI3_9BACT|nr:L-threonylcarbamoyladenylate synthase [Arachidicoccus rhizosphaerae]SEA11746.1 L-threonylcarbamoyladenylate synthase [Arachidicoccus rhizosphaerae]